MKVYEEVFSFLSPPWDANARSYQRADLSQKDYNTLNTWVQEVSEFKSPSAAKYVAQTAKIESLLKSLRVETEKEYAKLRGLILQHIEEQGVATPQTLSRIPSELLSMMFRRMRLEGLIEWSYAQRGYVRH